jgi:hypothetical protein
MYNWMRLSTNVSESRINPVSAPPPPPLLLLLLLLLLLYDA